MSENNSKELAPLEKVLQSKNPIDCDSGWVEYCIMKFWEYSSNSDEYIADEAADELAKLRARIIDLEKQITDAAEML